MVPETRRPVAVRKPSSSGAVRRTESAGGVGVRVVWTAGGPLTVDGQQGCCPATGVIRRGTTTRHPHPRRTVLRFIERESVGWRGWGGPTGSVVFWGFLARMLQPRAPEVPPSPGTRSERTISCALLDRLCSFRVFVWETVEFSRPVRRQGSSADRPMTDERGWYGGDQSRPTPRSQACDGFPSLGRA